MNTASPTRMNDPMVAHDGLSHLHGHGLSWAAIVGGVFLSMAVSIILVMLGSALELSFVSPWSLSSGSAASFSVKVAIWFIVVQWVSAGMGGYLSGRLRCKWHGLHTHEVFFRDTAHGLVTWAVATVLMTALFASSGAAILGGAASKQQVPLQQEPVWVRRKMLVAMPVIHLAIT